jgi:hypothetical protein
MTRKSQADHLTQPRVQGVNAEFPRFFVGSCRLRMNGGKAENGVFRGCFAGNVLLLFDHCSTRLAKSRADGDKRN